MNTVLHLVAMPLAYPLHPSSQLGYLHGFVQQAYGERVPVRSYHAFLPILYALEGADMGEFFETYSLCGEEILYLACSYQASIDDAEHDLPPSRNFDDALDRYNSYRMDPDNEAQQPLVPISREKVVDLCAAMTAYLDAHLLPSLRADALNVIAFTASFCQVFGSIFAARYIHRHTRKPTLFVFGGSSYSLPEGSRTLAAWQVDGLLVSGSGEAPLAALLDACLALDDASDPLDTIPALGLTNVARIGCVPRALDLTMEKDYLGSLPDPHYDDYFESLAALCSDDRAYQYALNNIVSIPLEGSRGCFAKCDFCHNPNITSQFRSLTGAQVAERALAMIDRYQVPDITFVDSVSNTWAEAYADHLLAAGRQVTAFAEMRVHAPESFWVKLALSGATTIQLGVEAISEPLLRNMRKGTTVMQNLAATKYMAEMGTNNASNLIIHHPKSTVADVEETKRVMQFLEHFPIFLLSSFVVSYASPLYNELSDEQKASLHRGFDWLPHEFECFGWPRHLSYTWPRAWFDRDTMIAWLEFQLWYADHVRAIAARAVPPSFTVERVGDDQLLLVDTRFDRTSEHTLRGERSRIYAACHKPGDANQIAERCGLAVQTVERELADLTAKRLLIQIGEQYLSIAFRPRAELVENLRHKLRSGPRRSSALTLAHVDGVC